MENFTILSRVFQSAFSLSVLVEVNLEWCLIYWCGGQSPLSLASSHIKGDKESEEPKCYPHFKGSSPSGSCYSPTRRVKSNRARGPPARYSSIHVVSTLGPGRLPRPTRGGRCRSAQRMSHAMPF